MRWRKVCEAGGLIARAVVLGAVGLFIASAIVACLDAGPGSTPAGFGDEDVDRTGFRVTELPDTAGFVSREEALKRALESYDPPDPDVLIDAFLLRVTDPESLRSDAPISDRPVWIVRYSGLEIVSPGGVEVQYRYGLHDAVTGHFLGATWAP